MGIKNDSNSVCGVQSYCLLADDHCSNIHICVSLVNKLL